MDKLLGLIPFMIMENGKQKFNSMRAFEAIIIGLVIGIFMWYVGFRELQKDVEFNRIQIELNRANAEKQQEQLKSDMKSIDDKLWKILEKGKK